MLVQYKSDFLAWEARSTNKSYFETVYFVFSLKILRYDENFEKIFKSTVWLSYNLSYKLNNWIKNCLKFDNIVTLIS